MWSRELRYGGELGIRTLDRSYVTYTRLAGERLQPLGQLSAFARVDISRYIPYVLELFWRMIRVLNITPRERDGSMEIPYENVCLRAVNALH